MVRKLGAKKKPKKKKKSTSTLPNGNVADKIAPVHAVRSTLNCLIYGEAGVGKTRASATAPKPLIVDCNEKGTMSIRDMEGVDVYELERFDELTSVLRYLRGDHGYETAVFDSITGLSQVCMRQVLDDQSAMDASKDPSLPAMRDYGKANELMRQFILESRDLEMNVIFTALERIRTDDETGESQIMPSLTPGVMNTALAQVDVVGWIHVHKSRNKKTKKSKTIRRLLVGPSPFYATKDRLGLYGRYVINPNFTDMVNAIGGKGKEAPEEEED